MSSYKFLLFCILLASSLAVVGCGGTQETTKEAAISEPPTTTELPTTTTTTQVAAEERKKALGIVWAYKLQKEVAPNIHKGITLKQAFDEMGAADLIKTSTGWFSVKEGDRIVVGWKGRKVGFIHYPEWAVKNDEISALNGSAMSYTPELEEQFGGVAGVSELDRKIGDRFNAIMEKEIVPIQSQKLDWAGMDRAKNEIVDEWYRKAESAALLKAAKPYGLSLKQAEEAWMRYSMQESEQRSQFSKLRGKILSPEEIDKLVEEQGMLD